MPSRNSSRNTVRAKAHLREADSPDCARPGRVSSLPISSPIREANTIIVTDRRRFVEQCDHQELMQSHGLYYEFYNSQFTEATI